MQTVASAINPRWPETRISIAKTFRTRKTRRHMIWRASANRFHEQIAKMRHLLQRIPGSWDSETNFLKVNPITFLKAQLRFNSGGGNCSPAPKNRHRHYQLRHGNAILHVGAVRRQDLHKFCSQKQLVRSGRGGRAVPLIPRVFEEKEVGYVAPERVKPSAYKITCS